MTDHSTTNNATFDWTGFIATAMYEGGQAFLKTISSAAPKPDDVQLTQDENQADRRMLQALDYAKRSRTNFEPHVLSAVRNWARKQAIAILREKVAGKEVRPDFYNPFQLDLQQEVATMISDIQQFWDQEDEQREAAAMQRLAAKRQEAEQAFGAAYPFIRGLSDAVLSGEEKRQRVFESGQQTTQEWANKYENSVKAREKQLEEREKLIQQQERENREHQLAMRSLAKWDDKNSFVNSVVSTGKNTIGCLIVWFLLFVGILTAIYFAFPHH